MDCMVHDARIGNLDIQFHIPTHHDPQITSLMVHETHDGWWLYLLHNSMGIALLTMYPIMQSRHVDPIHPPISPFM